jgi:hypothetical protein
MTANHDRRGEKKVVLHRNRGIEAREGEKSNKKEYNKLTVGGGSTVSSLGHFAGVVLSAVVLQSSTSRSRCSRIRNRA